MSRFGDLKKNRASEPAAPTPAPSPPPVPSPAPVQAKPEKPKGRGKNPDYVQVSAYISRKVSADVERALFDSGRKRQFSVLIEDLLTKWLADTSRTQPIDGPRT